MHAHRTATERAIERCEAASLVVHAGSHKCVGGDGWSGSVRRSGLEGESLKTQGGHTLIWAGRSQHSSVQRGQSATGQMHHCRVLVVWAPPLRNMVSLHAHGDGGDRRARRLDGVRLLVAREGRGGAHNLSVLSGWSRVDNWRRLLTRPQAHIEGPCQALAARRGQSH